jgi:cytochrome c oxidase subunit 2
VGAIFRTQAAPPKDALRVKVIGHQWWWEFQYPELGVVTASDLHLPAGRPVSLEIASTDVIHSFWVPQLGGKRDAIPGSVTRIVLTAEGPGEYYGQCAEFCGASHANMGMRIIVDTPEAFARWVAAQKAVPAEPAAGPAADGKAIFAASACVGCHTIRGVSTGTLGPDLTTFGGRRTLAAGLLPITVETVTAWLKNPPALKPDAKMPALGLSDDQARAVATYLIGLK